MKFWIYTLIDPVTSQPRYIGWTVCVKRRLQRHLEEARRGEGHSYRLRWVRSLLRRRLKPELLILEEGFGDWQSAERGWIKLFRHLGYWLTNTTDGGEGVPGLRFSLASRKRLARSHRGHKQSTETKLKRATSLRGKKRNTEASARAAEKNRGQKRNRAARKRMALAHRGKKHSKATKLKLSLLVTGRKHSPETKAKLAHLQLGRKHTKRTRCNMSRAHIGNRHSIVTRKKMSIARKLYLKQQRSAV